MLAGLSMPESAARGPAETAATATEPTATAKPATAATAGRRRRETPGRLAVRTVVTGRPVTIARRPVKTVIVKPAAGAGIIGRGRRTHHAGPVVPVRIITGKSTGP